jgi:hypothetical protein
MLKPDYKWPRLLDFAERKRQQSIPKVVLPLS